MLVAEDGDRTATVGKDTANLLHKIFTREELLLPLVPRIIAMFADQKDAIHREFLAAQGEGFDNALVDRHVELGRNATCHVLVRKLVDIHRYDLSACGQQTGV